MMPGFRAENSLLGMNRRYRREAAFADPSRASKIIPQRMKLTTVHCNCDSATDICVCDNGRVLHAVLGDI